MEFYVGTLTREGGEGILRCRLKGDSLERTGLIGAVTDPNYLILSPDGTRLYAVSSDADENGMKGCVNEYDLTGQKPRLLSRQSTFGNGPCFLCLSPDEKTLYCANYGTGSVAVFPREDTLRPAVQVVKHEGSGPHPTRQAGPHVHQVTFLPGTRILCAADLGTDELWLYDASPEDGRLSLRDKVKLHGGPRHIAYGTNGMAYLAHELSSEVTVLHFRNGLRPVQTLSALPEGFEGKNTAAAIRVSGGRVWVSNRGHGSVAVFRIKEDGLLERERFLPAGEYPRDFILLPGDRLLTADQHGGVLLENDAGRTLDFIPQMGAVCVAAVQ